MGQNVSDIRTFVSQLFSKIKPLLTDTNIYIRYADTCSDPFTSVYTDMIRMYRNCSQIMNMSNAQVVRGVLRGSFSHIPQILRVSVCHSTRITASLTSYHCVTHSYHCVTHSYHCVTHSYHCILKNSELRLYY
jgi:hypothetical protein